MPACMRLNEAEYEALAASLKITRELGIRDQKAHSDSQLIVGHIQGHYEVRGENMMKYLRKIKDLVSQFASFEIQ